MGKIQEIQSFTIGDTNHHRATPRNPRPSPPPSDISSTSKSSLRQAASTTLPHRYSPNTLQPPPSHLTNPSTEQKKQKEASCLRLQGIPKTPRSQPIEPQHRHYICREICLMNVLNRAEDFKSVFTQPPTVLCRCYLPPPSSDPQIHPGEVLPVQLLKSTLGSEQILFLIPCGERERRIKSNTQYSNTNMTYL